MIYSICALVEAIHAGGISRDRPNVSRLRTKHGSTEELHCTYVETNRENANLNRQVWTRGADCTSGAARRIPVG